MNCVVGPVSIALPCHFVGADQSSAQSNYHVEQKKALERNEKKTVHKKRKNGKRRRRRRRANGKTHASKESRSDVHSKQPFPYNSSHQLELNGNHTIAQPLLLPQQNFRQMHQNVSVGAAPQNTQYTQHISNAPTSAQYNYQPSFGSHDPSQFHQLQSHGIHAAAQPPLPPQQNVHQLNDNITFGAAQQNTQYTQSNNNAPTAAQYIHQPAFGSHEPAIYSSHMTDKISQSHQLPSHGIHTATQPPLAPQQNTCQMNHNTSVAAAPQYTQYNNNAPAVAQYIQQQSVGSLNPAPSSSQNTGQDTTSHHNPQQPYVCDGPSVLPMEGEELSFPSSHPVQYVHQQSSGSPPISSSQETRDKTTPQHSPKQAYVSDGPSVLPTDDEQLFFQPSDPVQYIHHHSSRSPPIPSNQEPREKTTPQHSPKQPYVCEGPSVLPVDDKQLFFQSSDPTQYRHVDSDSKYVGSSQLISVDQPPQLSPVSCHQSHSTFVKSDNDTPACSRLLMNVETNSRLGSSDDGIPAYSKSLMNAETNSRLVGSSDDDTPARSLLLMSAETKAMLVMRLTRTLLIEKMKVPEVTMPHIDAHPDCYDPASPGYEASINSTKRGVEYDPSNQE